LLPRGRFAIAEEVVGGPESDVVTLKTDDDSSFQEGHSNVALAEPLVKPQTSFVMKADVDRYVAKVNRIRIEHDLGEVVAVIKLVSPGNKISGHAIRQFVEKSIDLILQKINLLVIDPFPPGPRDPQGIHDLIWEELTGQTFELPPDRSLTMVAYQVSPIKTAYVEPICIGTALPVMPVFLQDDYYVNLPLEETYAETWNVLPGELRAPLEP